MEGRSSAQKHSHRIQHLRVDLLGAGASDLVLPTDRQTLLTARHSKVELGFYATHTGRIGLVTSGFAGKRPEADQRGSNPFAKEFRLVLPAP